MPPHSPPRAGHLWSTPRWRIDAADDRRIGNDQGVGDTVGTHDIGDHAVGDIGDRALGDQALCDHVGDTAIGEQAVGDLAIGDQAVGDIWSRAVSDLAVDDHRCIDGVCDRMQYFMAVLRPHDFDIEFVGEVLDVDLRSSAWPAHLRHHLNGAKNARCF